MKATIDNTTGLMIESQSNNAHDAALLSNAQNAGFLDVSIRVVNDAEHAALIAARDAARPSPVPHVVSMRQARLALLGAGLLDAVTAGVTTIGQAAAIEWEYATEVRRDSALIASLAPSLGLTSTQIDALFVTAGNL